MKFDTIVLERVKGMAIITFGRSGRVNAVSIGMYQKIHTALEEVTKDKRKKVLVVAGARQGFMLVATLMESQRVCLHL